MSDQPQFEAGREKSRQKGVVRDKAVHLEVIEMVIAFAKSIGFEILNLEIFTESKGPEGNIEYLHDICRTIRKEKMVRSFMRKCLLIR